MKDRGERESSVYIGTARQGRERAGGREREEERERGRKREREEEREDAREGRERVVCI